MNYGWWILAWLIYGGVFIGKEVLARTRAASLKADGFREKNPIARLRNRRSRMFQGIGFAITLALLEAIFSGLFHSGNIIMVLCCASVASMVGLYCYRVSGSLQRVGDVNAGSGLKERDEEWVRVSVPLPAGGEHGTAETEPAGQSNLADRHAVEPVWKERP